jgi:hypothetical protein
MTLKAYFEEKKGTGVLATANSEGRVDAAIYSNPYFMEDGTVAFIMMDRLTLANIQSNPYATYLFMEEGERYKGKRLFLQKIRQENNPNLIQKMIRQMPSYVAGDTKFLLYFKLLKELPLVGDMLNK